MSFATVLDKKKYILVTGGHGFIGSHVTNRLHSEGYRIRVADKSPNCPFEKEIYDDILIGNLCDADFCAVAISGVQAVLHFAANMGGMGTIHSENDFPIYEENSRMTLNLLRSSVENKVKLFFYASSACVYPHALQADLQSSDINLKEEDAWSHFPPTPQGLYGLEKFISEILLLQYKSQLEIRIARFHNVYGPRGAWCNGHEKAPAALLRKAFVAQKTENKTIEVWGNGAQRRSFLFIDDCVDAIVKLLGSDYQEPINIGSDNAVSIKELASIAWKTVNGNSEQVQFKWDGSRPVGVSSRNSENTRVKTILDWRPKVSLETGMRKTAEWMSAEMDLKLKSFSVEKRALYLEDLRCSQVVDLKAQTISFALLLPITSRGSDSSSRCLENLASFARSLAYTTWRDTHEIGGIRFKYKVYIAIDEDDHYLLDGLDNRNKALQILYENGIASVDTTILNHPKGHVCAIWRECARKAWKDNYEFFVLLGDDVILEDEGWMRNIYLKFKQIADAGTVPFGFGCVAFTDISFPGMPTFPVIHRRHMEIFDGEVIPDNFINQDGDPYLFQLYRRWGCSSMVVSRIRNAIGGSDDARYKKQHAVDWTYDCLDEGASKVETYLDNHDHSIKRKLTLDVVVPCYRVQLPLLKGILDLKPSINCTVMFIIIVDDPTSPHVFRLQDEYGNRHDVRIRVNKENMGASASRNRGIEESAAEWIIFLDDDVVPNPDVLVEAEKIIRAHPRAAGFVGNVQFPVADTVFKSAVHLAGVTYFWDIAKKWNDGDVPWGVTANLIARRNNDGIKYDLGFPKTGGGEDIDFCLKKHDFFVKHKGEGFYPAPEVTVTHPWWNNGKRSYWRYYMWSKGDGALVKLYPEYSYWDISPSSAELLLLIAMLSPALFSISLWTSDVHFAFVPLHAVVAVILGNIAHDTYRHLWRYKDRTRAVKSSLSGLERILAIFESSFIRIASESGRLAGVLERREFLCLGRRFDWFVGRAGSGPRQEEQSNSLQRLSVSVSVFFLITSLRGWDISDRKSFLTNNIV